MDYIRIVLKGFIDSTTRPYLSEYFIREFKKAEKEHFGADEFFGGCLKVPALLVNKLRKYYNEDKRDARYTLRVLESETPQNLNEINEQKKYLEYLEKAGLDHTSVELYPYISIYYELSNEEIKEIRGAITQAFIQVVNPIQITPPQGADKIARIKNKFDKVDISEVYTHFKTGLVEKGYLTEQVLYEYLKAAFELEAIPETLFKIQDPPSKEKIYLIFYTYYVNVAGKPHGKQPHYVELLGNYFEGYNNDTIKTNWAKGYNPKKH